MKTSLNQDLYDDELDYLCIWLEAELGIEFTETSGYRPGDKGVHGAIPCRGRDLRCRDAFVGQAVCDFINRSWTYDPDRPELKVALYHGEGMNAHIHLQVHPHTVHG